MFEDVEWAELHLKRETGDDGEGVEADGKDERKRELKVETGGGRVFGSAGLFQSDSPAGSSDTDAL